MVFIYMASMLLILEAFLYVSLFRASYFAARRSDWFCFFLCQSHSLSLFIVVAWLLVLYSLHLTSLAIFFKARSFDLACYVRYRHIMWYYSYFNKTNLYSDPFWTQMSLGFSKWKKN